MQKYDINDHPISTVLSWINSNEVAIPEIQRPFVWSSTKVRDLMDSLYQGYPIGYIIAWKNPNVKLKGGNMSEGKKILIDGQQRLVALKAAILGEVIIDKDYKEKRIYIAFHPLKEEFATLTPAIKKDVTWIPDISKLMKKDGMLIKAYNEYCEKNPEVSQKKVEKNLTKLIEIKNKPIGFIELASALDIEEVTEIFIRINSKGVVLGQADFAMSKIASYDVDEYGINLRKCLDYFAHLSRDPKFIKKIEEYDDDFVASDYFNKISWLSKENENLYDPDYADILRVSFTKKFERGKISELVGLLSGRNFETRSYEQEIMEKSFKELKESVLDSVNEQNFKRFIMILKSAGFISKSLVRSQNALNFAYIVYLKLKEKGVNPSEIESHVKKWYVMSVLTGRYSGSPESQIDTDIKNISKKGINKYFESIEEAELSDAFWNSGLVSELDKSTMHTPYLSVFFAAQVKSHDNGFLSTDISVDNMISHRGDIHHIFPKEYLKKIYTSKSDYNQIANYVYAQTEINIKIGKKAPKEYFADIIKQCNGGKIKYGGIDNMETLKDNLKQHCIPENVMEMELEDYPKFLEERRKMMANKIKHYYNTL